VVKVMSRIGRAPIAIPKEAQLKVDGLRVGVEGPKGKLSLTLPQVLTARLTNGVLQVERKNDEKPVKALHGLYRALIANMVTGTVTGFIKELEVVGIGYRAQLQGKSLTLNVGFSHPVVLPIPEGLTVEVPKPTAIVVKGCNRQLVGQFAANIRRVAPPEPYKGKGIKFVGEVIRRKAGKAATGAGAKSSGK